MKRILLKIKLRLRFHNPKMLFCNHKYIVSWMESDRYGVYTSYMCKKCRKCITIQKNTMMSKSID